VVGRITPSSGLDRGAGTSEIAFEQWLESRLHEGLGPTPSLTLAAGAASFRDAAAGSTYRQTKNALVEALMYAREHRPELVEPLFAAIEPYMRARLEELPPDERVKEEAQLSSKKLEVEVQIPIPEDMLERLNAAQREMAERLFRELGGAAESDLDRSERRSERVQNRIAVHKAQAVVAPKEKVDSERWGAFLGRLVSRCSTGEESKFLDLLVEKGRYEKDLVMAMELSGFLAEMPEGGTWIRRVSAGIQLASRTRYQGPKDTLDKLALEVLSKSDPTPLNGYTPLVTTKDGDIESMLMRWIGVSAPGLLEPMVMNHPHIPTTDQLPAASEQLDRIAEEQGRFLEGYNVMMVMHQMGRTVPWLELLHEKLGLVKEDYLGISVPYSGSAIAIERMNREGFETWERHDDRNPLLAKLQDTLGGGNPKGFDELKEDEIKAAVQRMIDKHQENGKPILIVDDGGYVSKVIRAHFSKYEDQFKIVEWTTRGIRQFEEIKDPKMPLVSGAESRPKVEIEPAFVAESLVEHFLVAMRGRLDDLAKKKILVVGAGNIGRAVALAAADRGAEVTLNDLKTDKLEKAAKGTKLLRDPDLEHAVKGKHAILAITGANSMPPEIVHLADPETVIAAGSSVDIETRSPNARDNGHWGTDLSKLSLRFERTKPRRSKKEKTPRFDHPVNQAGIRALSEGLEAAAKKAGFTASIEARHILAGGYVLNFDRRVRIMPIQQEEVILLNVNESLAQAVTTTKPGKNLLAPEREDRIEELYEKHHPEEMKLARRFREE
jgi:NAD(P)-dependent dehydrogenase (short-subunit alcohol dehydrogenase family)